MIAADGLVKHHNGVPILRGVSLAVAPGEVAVVIGPSGSGKSTLLRCVNGLERFEGGMVTVDGLALTADAAAADRERIVSQVRRRVGMVFQGFHLFPHRTVLENVTEGPIYVLGMGREPAEERARRLLDRVGLGDRLDHHPSQLSGGQQQRVAIARALINSPPLLFADEPTGNLDSKTSDEILLMFQKLNREEGITIILVTHEAEVAAHARRIIHIRDGLISDGHIAH